MCNVTRVVIGGGNGGGRVSCLRAPAKRRREGGGAPMGPPALVFAAKLLCFSTVDKFVNTVNHK